MRKFRYIYSLNIWISKLVAKMLEKRLARVKKIKDGVLINAIFEDIFNEYSKLVAFIISKYVHIKEDVEDLVMDVFLKFYEAALKNDITNIKAYLAVIAKNTSISFLKKEKNIFIEYDDNVYLEDSTDNTTYNDIITKMKSVLNDEEVNIIILKVVYGYTFKELALKNSQKPSTISSKYFRAINRFKRSYKE